MLQQDAVLCLLWYSALGRLLEHRAHKQEPHQGAFVLCEQVALGVIMGPCLARAPSNQVEGVSQQRQGEQQPPQLLKELLQTQCQTRCQSGCQRTQAAYEDPLGRPQLSCQGHPRALCSLMQQAGQTGPAAPGDNQCTAASWLAVIPLPAAQQTCGCCLCSKRSMTVLLVSKATSHLEQALSRPPAMLWTDSCTRPASVPHIAVLVPHHFVKQRFLGGVPGLIILNVAMVGMVRPVADAPTCSMQVKSRLWCAILRGPQPSFGSG